MNTLPVLPSIIPALGVKGIEIITALDLSPLHWTYSTAFPSMQTWPHNATIGEVAEPWRFNCPFRWTPPSFGTRPQNTRCSASHQHYVILQISVQGKLMLGYPFIFYHFEVQKWYLEESSEIILRMTSAFGNRTHVMAKFSECFGKYCSCVLKINPKDSNTLCGILPKAQVLSVDFCSPGNSLILDREFQLTIFAVCSTGPLDRGTQGRILACC